MYHRIFKIYKIISIYKYIKKKFFINFHIKKIYNFLKEKFKKNFNK